MVIIIAADPAISAIPLRRSSVMRQTLGIALEAVNAHLRLQGSYRTKRHLVSRNSSRSARKADRSALPVKSTHSKSANTRVRSPNTKNTVVPPIAEKAPAKPLKKKLAQPAAAKKQDRRVKATRNALGDAIVALIQEKPFDTITVQHVLDRAKVSRSTFYSHYSDTNDLFLSDAEEFFEMMSSALTRHGDTSNRVAPVEEFFAHLAEMRKFYSAIVASRKIQDVMDLGLGHFARGIDQRLATLPATRNLSASRRSALAHASAGSLLSLLTWWLHHGASTTPAQMDALYHQMIWSGINLPANPALPKPRALTLRKPLR